MDVQQARHLVLEAGKRLLSSGLVAGTWGNISQKVNDNLMVITPSGKNYDKLTVYDMVVVNINDLSYEGQLKPSSECKLHAELYKIRKDIGAVIHTHSINACIVASARKEVTSVSDHMADRIGPSIPVTEYAISGTRKLLKNTIKLMKYGNAVLLANHGAICVGKTIENAFITCELMEKACMDFIEK
ncbi:class II aldolase/adducin family protein [Wukongibacter baidiensis]|uniref:class II aldolase/adducin family protein n=1 Tax=Wukongibacter baidiensis TaxID=1723361 RepID=UPI003D7FD3DF